MATPSGATAVHATLTASTVDTATLTAPNVPSVTVVNRTGTAEIYFTISSTAAGAVAPTVGGANCFVLPAAICSLTVPISSGQVVVSLISSGTMAYSVEGLL